MEEIRTIKNRGYCFDLNLSDTDSRDIIIEGLRFAYNRKVFQRVSLVNIKRISSIIYKLMRAFVSVDSLLVIHHPQNTPLITELRQSMTTARLFLYNLCMMRFRKYNKMR